MKKIILAASLMCIGAAANALSFSCPDCTFECENGKTGSSGQYGSWWKAGTDCAPKADRLANEIKSVCADSKLKEGSLTCQKWTDANKKELDDVINMVKQAGMLLA